MSITLRDIEGQELRVNAWNWAVLHERVLLAAILPEKLWKPMRVGGGTSLDDGQVAKLASFLEDELLPRIGENARMFLDGSVTETPDDGTLYAEPELWKNYSLHHVVLCRVIDFLRAARAPVSC